MKTQSEFTLAAVQAAPVYFDQDASTEKAVGLIQEASQKGADLVAFGETWLPGYPFFRNAGGAPIRHRAAVDYLSNAVEIPSPTTERLCAAAQNGDIDVVMGIVELDATTRATVYCSLLFIGREGRILGRHRKLKPSSTERAVWGEGDGVGLDVYQRSYGRISGLNCWEHKMLLPAYALMAQGTQIHVAAWPFFSSLAPAGGNGRLLSRAFAEQGGCFVIAPGALLEPEEIPEHYRHLAEGATGAEGGSCIIAPGGKVIAEAASGEETILIARGSLESVLQEKARCDVGGHYSRPDVLQLHVNRRPLLRVIENAGTVSFSSSAEDIHYNSAAEE